MNAYTQLLSQVVRDRCASRMMTRISVIMILCLMLLFATRWILGPTLPAELLPVWLGCFLPFMWAGAFLKNAIQQNLPSNACLVPGLRGRLKALTAAVYAACSLAVAAVIGLTMGHAGYALVAGGLFSAYMLFAQRYSVMNFLPTVVIVGSAMFQNRPYRAVLDATVSISEPAFTGVGLIVVALLFLWGLAVAFPQGGDAHWAWLKRFQFQQAKLQGRLAGAAPGRLRWLAWMHIPYKRALARDSRPGAAPSRLLMHALGRGTYDGSGLLFLLCATLIMSAIGSYVGKLGDTEGAAVLSTVMQGSLMFCCLTYATQAAGAIVRHGDEQRLYCLTPSAPSPAAINRVMFGTLLFRFLRMWVVTLLCAFCIELATLGIDGARSLTWMLAAVTLMFAGVLLRYYAWLPPRSNDAIAAFLIIVCIAIDIALLVCYTKYPSLPWFGMACAVTLLTALCLALRWRRLIAAPAMLPAGRLLA